MSAMAFRCRGCFRAYPLLVWSFVAEIVIPGDVYFSYHFREEFMAKAYSLDLSARVLKDCDAGIRSEDVAPKYSVSASWVYDLRKKRRETGIIAPKQQRHGSKPKLEPYEQEVRQLVADHPHNRRIAATDICKRSRMWA